MRLAPQLQNPLSTLQRAFPSVCLLCFLTPHNKGLYFPASLVDYRSHVHPLPPQKRHSLPSSVGIEVIHNMWVTRFPLTVNNKHGPTWGQPKPSFSSAFQTIKHMVLQTLHGNLSPGSSPQDQPSYLSCAPQTRAWMAADVVAFLWAAN